MSLSRDIKALADSVASPSGRWASCSHALGILAGLRAKGNLLYAWCAAALMLEGRLKHREAQLADMILERPYTRVVMNESNLFSASIVEFPGVFACGDTEQEARENLERAAHSWILACFETGIDIPAPKNANSKKGKVQ